MTWTDEKCPDCGGELRFVDQTSFSGNKIREFKCEKCGREVIEDMGVALWKVLHDANEEEKEKKKK
ncbi:MAG: hypothetical protein WAM91_09170 [Candidatus Acidiferrales bacterium]